jgi:hypothetical protein
MGCLLASPTLCWLAKLKTVSRLCVSFKSIS